MIRILHTLVSATRMIRFRRNMQDKNSPENIALNEAQSKIDEAMKILEPFK